MSLPLRSRVLSMEPYSPGRPIADVKREFGLDRVIKLASNENPYGPSPKAVTAVQQAAAEMHLYPDAAAVDLRGAMSKKFAVPVEQILLGNGSDELIHLLGLVMLGNSSDEVMMATPGFSRYDASAHVAGCQLVKVGLNSDLEHDLGAMAKAITERTRLIYLPNPHNPTGTIVLERELNSFLEDVPAHALLVLDEAYYEYAASAPGFPASIELAMTHPNVVVLRTFSKALGLAGIRIGYGIAPIAVADAVNRAREPFDVNSLAQVAAIAALEDDAYVSSGVKKNREGLDKLASAFTRLGAHPYPSHANFLLADLHRPADPIFQALLSKGIITRSGAAMGLPNCLRVSIGTEEEMALLMVELEGLLSQVGVS